MEYYYEYKGNEYPVYNNVYDIDYYGFKAT